MPQYRVKQKSFINNAMREEGEIVDYEGTPSSNLEPMDASAVAAVANSAGANMIDRERMSIASVGGDPDTVQTPGALV